MSRTLTLYCAHNGASYESTPEEGGAAKLCPCHGRPCAAVDRPAPSVVGASVVVAQPLSKELDAALPSEGEILSELQAVGKSIGQDIADSLRAIVRGELEVLRRKVSDDVEAILDAFFPEEEEPAADDKPPTAPTVPPADAPAASSPATEPAKV